MNYKIVKVFLAKIPEKIEYKPLYPSERFEEISSCKSEKVKRQKYAVWELLKYVLEKEYNLRFENIKFTKSVNGKWLANCIYFSLAHSGDYVAVCVDNRPIGLDIEYINEQKMTNKLLYYITTNIEKQAYNDEPTAAQIAMLWAKKEAIFKFLNKPFFKPSNIEIKDYVTATEVKNDLIVSVCGEVEKIEIINL